MKTKSDYDAMKEVDGRGIFYSHWPKTVPAGCWFEVADGVGWKTVFNHIQDRGWREMFRHGWRNGNLYVINITGLDVISGMGEPNFRFDTPFYWKPKERKERGYGNND